ncbi:MAG: hypothetical protein M1457_00585, partial [bacterium]|nr:hypothetical protein [bacterium]
MTPNASAAPADLNVPRPEHPRPDFERAQWLNLNGPWQFAFDDENRDRLDRTIQVPFCWQAPLSGIAGGGGRKVGWYERAFATPDWPGRRVHLVIGAADREARVWVNGVDFGTHQSGYLPIRLDVTDALKSIGQTNRLRIRVYDPQTRDLPEGKQIPNWYTHTSGIWQTVYLEAVGDPMRIDAIRIAPDVKGQAATIRLEMTSRAGDFRDVTVRVATDAGPAGSWPLRLPCGAFPAAFELPVPNPRLWFPEDPYLYHLTIDLLDDASGAVVDSVRTWFGMRDISTGFPEGVETASRYVLLNGRPLYVTGALDQAFNRGGIYTYPDEAMMLTDIREAKAAGLNLLRLHIKTEEPRFLYLCDREGMLLQCDVPNYWDPNQRARSLWEWTMRGMIERDFNHPAIISWMMFNETWGLGVGRGKPVPPEHFAWARLMFDEAKALDPTRLVEDMSACNHDHFTERTDLVSWHHYGLEYEKTAERIRQDAEGGRPGSGVHFIDGMAQGDQPFINSEYGGIGAGSGDSDVSWTSRWWTNELRKYSNQSGFIYTELMDIEWEHNGVLRYGREPKEFGYGALAPGMEVRHVFGEDFLVMDAPPVVFATPGAEVRVPLAFSHFSPTSKDRNLTLRWNLRTWNADGEEADTGGVRPGVVVARRFALTPLEPLAVRIPEPTDGDRAFCGAL